MVKRLVVQTGDASNLMSLVHELGKVFFCKLGRKIYKVLYFAQSTNVFFEGSLSNQDIERLKQLDAIEAKSIEIDEFNDEIRIVA